MIILLILLLGLFRFIAKKLILVAGIIHSLSGSTVFISSILSMAITGSSDSIVFLIVSIFQMLIGVVLIFVYCFIQKNESNQESVEQQEIQEEYKVEVSPEFEKWCEQYKKRRNENT